MQLNLYTTTTRWLEKMLVVFERLSVFKYLKKWDPKIEVAVGKWSLFKGGRSLMSEIM